MNDWPELFEVGLGLGLALGLGCCALSGLFDSTKTEPVAESPSSFEGVGSALTGEDTGDSGEAEADDENFELKFEIHDVRRGSDGEAWPFSLPPFLVGGSW